MKPTVLILEVHTKASLPVIESAHRHGRRVIAGSPARCCTGMFSRYPDERVVYPHPTKEAPAFRDWLRAESGAAAEYVDVKRRVAAEHASSNGYAQAKAPWFGKIWPRMQSFAQRTGWSD